MCHARCATSFVPLRGLLRVCSSARQHVVHLSTRHASRRLTWRMTMGNAATAVSVRLAVDRCDMIASQRADARRVPTRCRSSLTSPPRLHSDAPTSAVPLAPRGRLVTGPPATPHGLLPGPPDRGSGPRKRARQNRHPRGGGDRPRSPPLIPPEMSIFWHIFGAPVQAREGVGGLRPLT